MQIRPNAYSSQETNMKMITIIAIAIFLLAGVLFILFPNLAWAADGIVSDRARCLCFRVPNSTGAAEDTPIQVSGRRWASVSRHGDTDSPR